MRVLAQVCHGVSVTARRQFSRLPWISLRFCSKCFYPLSHPASSALILTETYVWESIQSSVICHDHFSAIAVFHCSDKKQVEDGEVYLVLEFEATVNHGGRRVRQLVTLHSQLRSREKWMLVFSSLSPFYSVWGP